MVRNQGKIEGLRLSNFTCFADLEVNFSEGINVIIGENGLGKTHLLKAVFAPVFYGVPGFETFNRGSVPEVGFIMRELNTENKIIISTGLLNVFGTNNYLALTNDKQQELRIELFPPIKRAYDPIFFPPGEMLSWYYGFIPSYENRENSIDYVYYLLAKKLAPLPLKGEKLETQMALIQELEKGLGFKVIRRDDEFFIAFAQDQVHNSKLVANGINKLAQLIYLIMNGSLTKNSIIFWDEPEAGLNPKYVVLVANFLQTLVKAGCQIFVATHDYLLSHTLSLAAEYRDLQPDTPLMRFHALYKTPEGTQIESADTLPEIQHNSILEEYSRFYKAEEDLFYQSMKVRE